MNPRHDFGELEFGLDTFGDRTVDATGSLLTHAEVIRNIVSEAQLADRLGLHVFGVGEHHRDDFAVSSPEVVLAAIAARTARIRLASAVTVLSTDDPVRVFERFATVDALSRGRAELVVGRGSFTESFPLFGYDLAQYEELFDEKLALTAQLATQRPVSWRGTVRSPLTDQFVYPPVEQGALRLWVGVGGSPESVVRAARHGLPIALAIIGGSVDRFLPIVDLYRRALREFGHPEQPIAVHSPGFVADSDAEAMDLLWPHYRDLHARIGAERGWPPMTRARFEVEASPHGALYAGSVETVAAKIVATVRTLGIDRFDLKYSNGTLGHEHLLAGIERFATGVVPLAHAALSSPQPPVTV